MDLVLLVCLAASPESCREERVIMSPEASESRMCMVGAVPVLAEWAGDHPEWQISRWKCERPGQVRVTRNAD